MLPLISGKVKIVVRVVVVPTSHHSTLSILKITVQELPISIEQVFFQNIFFLVIRIASVFGYIRFSLFRRLNRAVQASDVPAAAAALAAIRQLVALNLGLGLGLIGLVLIY